MVIRKMQEIIQKTNKNKPDGWIIKIKTRKKERIWDKKKEFYSERSSSYTFFTLKLSKNKKKRTKENKRNVLLNKFNNAHPQQ